MLYINERAYTIETYRFGKQPTINESDKIIQITLNIRVSKYTKPVQYSTIYKPTKFDLKVDRFHKNYTKKCQKQPLLETYHKLKQEFINYRDKVLKERPPVKTTEADTQTHPEDISKEQKIDDIVEKALREKREKFKKKGLIDGTERKDTHDYFQIGNIRLSDAERDELMKEHKIETETKTPGIDKLKNNIIALKQNELYDSINDDDYKTKKEKIQKYRSDTTKKLKKKFN